jgi:hypothetical protein
MVEVAMVGGHSTDIKVFPVIGGQDTGETAIGFLDIMLDHMDDIDK